MIVSPEARPEISDLVLAYDPETLARIDVRRAEVLDRLASLGMRQALRIVSSWPHAGGLLDRDYVDEVLLRAHLELQRLSEEFQQGERISRLLRPLVETVSDRAPAETVRVVDVGCGLGYSVRWLAARRALPQTVELRGCDYNAKLVEAANALSRLEGLRCEFSAENAFRLRSPATVYTSTGVIHHFRGTALDQFFAEQHRSGAEAFIHWDIKPSWLAPIGSYLFHRARMSEPLARHDGILSALRAHPSSELLRAARAACPGWKIGVFDGRVEALPVLKVMHALVGVRGELADAWTAKLGPLAARLEDFR